MRHLEHIKLFMYTPASFIQASLCCVVYQRYISITRGRNERHCVLKLRESFSMLTLDALRIHILKPLKFHLDIHNRLHA